MGEDNYISEETIILAWPMHLIVNAPVLPLHKAFRISNGDQKMANDI